MTRALRVAPSFARAWAPLPDARAPFAMRRSSPLLILVLVALAAAPALGDGDAAGSGDAADLPNFATMRVRELVAVLSDRGLECKGCAEKADYVAMARENYHLPVVPKAEEPADARGDDVDAPREGRSKEEVDEMLRKLGMSGGFEPSGDPERDALMKKLNANGIKFAGANNMPIDQLRNLADAMGNVHKRGAGAGGEKGKKKRSARKDDETAEEEL